MNPRECLTALLQVVVASVDVGPRRKRGVIVCDVAEGRLSRLGAGEPDPECLVVTAGDVRPCAARQPSAIFSIAEGKKGA